MARIAAPGPRKTSPSPLQPPWTPGPARYGVGVRHNVTVPMSDGVVLRADIHYPTEPTTGEPAAGPFPVLVSITPYGKKAPPPAAQIGGGATPYLIKRGYIEVMVDVRGTGASGGSFEMFGPKQAQDGVDLVAVGVDAAERERTRRHVRHLLPGRNQLFTAAAVGPDSPLKAIFPVMAANDFYRDAAAMGGVPHMRAVQGYGSTYRLLNIVNPSLEYLTRGDHERPAREVWPRCASADATNAITSARSSPTPPTAATPPSTDPSGTPAARPRPPAHRRQRRGGLPRRRLARRLPAWCAAQLRRTAERLRGTARRPRRWRPDRPTSDRIRLLMGPWYHVSDFDGLHLNALQLRWFDHWLKDDSTAAVSSDRRLRSRPSGAHDGSTPANIPLPEATPTRFYLSPAGRLSADAAPDDSEATLLYTPRGPIAGRSLEQWSLGMTSFIASQRGRRIRYDLDNRRLQRAALTYTTEPFTSPRLLAGPITLTVHATATTTETLWVAHLDDVFPDGTSRPLTQGALLGSLRALDPARTWSLPDGTVLHPHHISTRAAAQPVVPGELTRYDVEIFPTAALIESDHRLRLTLTTYDFPHLVPTKPARRALAGGRYQLRQGGTTPSYLVVPLADVPLNRADDSIAAG